MSDPTDYQREVAEAIDRRMVERASAVGADIECLRELMREFIPAVLASEEVMDRQVLGNLMAIINRDGGHRAAGFGSDEEAAIDAADKVSGLFGKIEELRAEVERLEALEE